LEHDDRRQAIKAEDPGEEKKKKKKKRLNRKKRKKKRLGMEGAVVI